MNIDQTAAGAQAPTGVPTQHRYVVEPALRGEGWQITVYQGQRIRISNYPTRAIAVEASRRLAEAGLPGFAVGG